MQAPRTLVLATALGFSAVTSGCFEDPSSTTDTDSDTADTDTDIDTDTEIDTGSGSDSDSGSEGCPADEHICVESVEGWAGPSLRYEGPATTPAPACPGALQIGFEGASALEIPPADCGCACDPPADVGCGGVRLEYHGPDAACGDPAQLMFPSDMCLDFGGEFFATRYWTLNLDELGVTGTPCQPSGEPDLPAPEYESRTLVCAGATDLGGCTSGSVCVPEPDLPFQSGYCVWREGDVQCPLNSSYSQRSVDYTGFDDERECTACGCGSLGGECSDVQIQLKSEPDCGGLDGGVVTEGSCVSATQAVDSGVFTYAVDPSCPVTGGELDGEVLELQPHTICCIP